MSKVKTTLYIGIIFCCGALFGSVMELHGKSVVSSAQAEMLDNGWRAVPVKGTTVGTDCYILVRPDNRMQSLNGFSCTHR